MADLLIVDDHAANLKLTAFLLESAGHSVRTAENADEALRAITVRVPALILMDLQMPGVDGYELTRWIKAAPETRHVPIIAVTAYAMTGDAEKARGAGCDAYVTKPIDTRALPRLVAELLARTTGLPSPPASGK